MGLVTLPKGINVQATLRLIEKKLCEESLVEFVKHAWRVVEPAMPYVHNWHIDFLAEHLEAITNEEQLPDLSYYNRLLANVPPGTMKSLLVSVFWSAWEWGPKNLPNLRIVSTSYSGERSAIDNIRFRDLIKSQWYQQHWGDRFELVKDGEEFISNDQKGWRRARPFSKLTGDRGDRVIIDDPHSTEMAESEAERKRTTRIFTESVPTRLNSPEKSAIVVIMQRLHEEDVSGVILESKNFAGVYDHIMLPMRYDPLRHCVTKLGYEDPRTEEGELLFEERFPEHVVKDLERGLGPYAAAGQLQQEPAPRGGGIVKDAWWQLWEDPQFPPFDYVLASMDTAYTKKTSNDPSAMTIWGVWSGARGQQATRSVDRYGRPIDMPAPREGSVATPSPKAMLVYSWEEHLEFHDLVEKTKKVCKRFKVDSLLIENKASGISVAQELVRTLAGHEFGVLLNNPKDGDKISRLHSVVHLFSEGMVYAPDKEWAEKVIRQTASFPTTKHDDLVDTVSQALRHLRDNGMFERSEEKAQSLYDQMRNYKQQSAPKLYPS